MRLCQIPIAALLLAFALPATSQDETRSFSTSASDDDIEEIIVTAPPPERGKVPTYERVFQIYESRRKGSWLYRQRKYEEAFPHLLAAARSGFKFAQARVGFLYQQGLGTPQDPYAAVGWLSVAADGTTHPEIRNYFKNLWERIPEAYVPTMEAVVDHYREQYSSKAHRVGCDMSFQAGTHIKKLTCRFMDEGIYQDFGGFVQELGGQLPEFGQEGEG
ncbi:MAG: hypothetical protein OXH09_21860 [Gammaproteobacteria bacterium]|nr:hypothetical protein [Gammaproteobacteria bacterium]